MKLEVGMYYRYKGIIGKYYKPDLGKPFFTNQHKYIWNEIANGGKFSHNIIDLIEVGDYVNGQLVYEYLEGSKIYLDGGDYGEILILEDGTPFRPIESIVTKEQFESISYKIGD